MRVSMRYLPLGAPGWPDQSLTGRALAEIAQAAEAAGFDGLQHPEHPFPPDAWLQEDGHHDLDQVVALSMAAASTTRIAVEAVLLIAAYRNPFLAAKSFATLDHLSQGRVVVGIGTGYLDGEFRALGAAFDERNELTDEAIVAMRRAWTEDAMTMSGRRFEVDGHTMGPRPHRAGGPPIWIGGNSRRAIRRAVELGDGWMPMPSPAHGISRRTASLSSIADLRRAIDYLRERCDLAGRTDPLGVAFTLGRAPRGAEELRASCRTAIDLAAVGVTRTSVGITAADSYAEYLRGIELQGAELVPALHAIDVGGRP